MKFLHMKRKKEKEKRKKKKKKKEKEKITPSFFLLKVNKTTPALPQKIILFAISIISAPHPFFILIIKKKMNFFQI